MLTGMMTNSGDRWCWHGPEVCKNTKWLNLYHYRLHTHSDKHKHHKQQQEAQVSVWKSMGKSFPEISSQNLAARLPSEHTRCKLQHLQNDYNLSMVCFPDFMYLIKQYQDICMFLYIQATPLSLQWMKTLARIVRPLFWAGQNNQQACLLWMQIFDGAFVLWMLNPETAEYVNTVFYHIYLAVTNIDEHIKD